MEDCFKKTMEYNCTEILKGKGLAWSECELLKLDALSKRQFFTVVDCTASNNTMFLISQIQVAVANSQDMTKQWQDEFLFQYTLIRVSICY